MDYKVYSNDDPRLALDLFTARSNVRLHAFVTRSETHGDFCRKGIANLFKWSGAIEQDVMPIHGKKNFDIFFSRTMKALGLNFGI